MQEVVGIWETAIRLLLGCPGQEVRINGLFQTTYKWDIIHVPGI